MLVEKELNSNFQQVLENILVEGKDYYKPNFLSKPYLLNSGAKKICNILELEKDNKISKEIHNYEQNLITFRVRYTFISVVCCMFSYSFTYYFVTLS